MKADVKDGTLNVSDLEKLVSIANQDIRTYTEQINHLKELNEEESKKGKEADKATLAANKQKADELKAKLDEAKKSLERNEAALELAKTK